MVSSGGARAGGPSARPPRRRAAPHGRARPSLVRGGQGEGRARRRAMAKAGKENAATAKREVRCAIYTRKSSEEGLEQDFNSLDAQREACEAFIKSQRGEGWVCRAQMYDDGGISGGTLERPALKALLSDIEAGEID